jgi:hypothetical protein
MRAAADLADPSALGDGGGFNGRTQIISFAQKFRMNVDCFASPHWRKIFF